MAAALMTGVAAGPATARHQPPSGELDFVSDPGDYIGGGRAYSYSSARRDRFSVWPTFKNGVSVSVHAANGDWWRLDVAPPEGQHLRPGRYDDAYRFPFQGPDAPGLDFGGKGRGCNRSHSSFTVEQISWWPEEGGLREFAVRFEQHCEGAAPALRGRVRVSAPVPPPPLRIEVQQDRTAAVSLRSGKATVWGTVRCNQDATVDVTASVHQEIAGIAARALSGREVACSTKPAPWRVTVEPYQRRYVPGRAKAIASASGQHEHYYERASVSRTDEVNLRPIP